MTKLRSVILASPPAASFVVAALGICLYALILLPHIDGDDKAPLQAAAAALPEVTLFTDGHERSVLRSGAKTHWTEGLLAYQRQDMDAAGEHFTALLEEKLPSCDRAAAAFWAYRALKSAGDDDGAAEYLALAAHEQPGFYSMIARAVTGETEDNQQAGDIRYPVPHWKPLSGYRVQPALLFAIIREESGFNPDARSPAGARGVMQLMPATAHAVARVSHVRGESNEPSVSMALGQSYLEQLMNTPSVGDNLIFLTAAYNAGPGSVAGWQHHVQYENDPLLFVESIPYNQTRDYVVSVIGNYWVYSALLGGHDNSRIALSQGQWPRYAEDSEQVSAMLSRLGAGGME